MTFTYTDPNSHDRDAIRFLIGDTTSPGDISDEELAYLMVEAGGNKYVAAEMAALSAITKMRGAVSKTVGDLSISSKLDGYTTALSHVRELINRMNPAGIHSGGLTDAERQTDQGNYDTEIAPSFEEDMHDFPGTSSAIWTDDE